MEYIQVGLLTAKYVSCQFYKFAVDGLTAILITKAKQQAAMSK